MCYVIKGRSMSINAAGLWESDNSFVMIFKTFAPSYPNHEHLVPCTKSSNWYLTQSSVNSIRLMLNMAYHPIKACLLIHMSLFQQLI